MRSDGFVTADDGVRIAYRDYGGTGRGLVLLHGIGGNLETMDQYAECLGQDRRAVSFDLRCCGQSDDADDASFEAMTGDINVVAGALGLGEVDVVGHSLGGMVAAFHAVSHPPSRIVSIDGFPPGSVRVADQEGRATYRRWLEGIRDQLNRMTGPPQIGDASWKAAQTAQLRVTLASIGYTAPNLEAVARRHFVRRADGMYLRHPARHLVDVLFADLSLDVLRPYRSSMADTLLIRCTGWAPPQIDEDLEELLQSRTNLKVVRLPIGHLAPAWDQLAQVSELIRAFWSRTAKATGLPPGRTPGGGELVRATRSDAQVKPSDTA